MKSIRRSLSLSSKPKRPAVTSFHELSDSDITYLASLLAHQPAPSLPSYSFTIQTYWKAVTAQLKTLPSHLAADKNVSPLIASCARHAKLNARLTRSVLVVIQNEIEIRIRGVLSGLAHFECLPYEIAQRFEGLRDVSCMWRGADRISDAAAEKRASKWARQSDGCSACVLARLGGDTDMLMLLKASLLITATDSSLASVQRHKYINALIQNGGYEAQTAFDIHAHAQALATNVVSLVQRLERIQQRLQRRVSDVPASDKAPQRYNSLASTSQNRGTGTQAVPGSPSRRVLYSGDLNDTVESLIEIYRTMAPPDQGIKPKPLRTIGEHSGRSRSSQRASELPGVSLLSSERDSSQGGSSRSSNGFPFHYEDLAAADSRRRYRFSRTSTRSTQSRDMTPQSMVSHISDLLHLSDASTRRYSQNTSNSRALAEVEEREDNGSSQPSSNSSLAAERGAESKSKVPRFSRFMEEMDEREGLAGARRDTGIYKP